jgi:DNA-binding NarL/FixJ family response regulator
MEKKDQSTLVILIVEDHPPTLTAVQTLVSGAFAGCRTLGAQDGETALALCASDPPHLVIMDILLPGVDGIETTRRIKSLLPATRIIMHSSHDLPVYREGSSAAGADGFVTKSRTFTDLVPALRSVLPPGLDGTASVR